MADLVARFGKVSAGLAATPEPDPAADLLTLPQWLRTRLIDQVGLSTQTVDTFTLEQGVDAWTAWSSRAR